TLPLVLLAHRVLLYFFFQAEDGIRDFHVTGVQTCALPISRRPGCAIPTCGASCWRCTGRPRRGSATRWRPGRTSSPIPGAPAAKIGRASCRERVCNTEVAITIKTKKMNEEGSE